MKTKQVHIVQDLAYGSTGKGALVGYLALKYKPDTAITAWAANAGHTTIHKGRKFVHTMLANSVISPNLRRILIGPGSVIDPDNLTAEYDQCRDLLQTTKIAIHPHAAIISQRHRDEEAGPMTKIGSTKKGCGAAAIQRIRRDPDDMNVAKFSDHPFIKHHVVSTEKYQQLLDEASVLMVEGAQGYGLSMYHGMYPYTTSRDVSTHQLLADCGIPYRYGDMYVYGCTRTFPIRVANRYDDNGNQVGYSGGCYPDQREISWRDLDIQPELTTVTKLPRRIFTFSDRHYIEAVGMMGVDTTFINFMNYLPSALSVVEFATRIDALTYGGVGYIGIGPTTDDIIEWDTNSTAMIAELHDKFKSSLGLGYSQNLFDRR